MAGVVDRKRPKGKATNESSGLIGSGGEWIGKWRDQKPTNESSGLVGSGSGLYAKHFWVFWIEAPRGHQHQKNIYGVDFFAKAFSSGLTNYVIRHNS